MDQYIGYTRDLLLETLAIPGCGGDTRAIMERMRAEFASLGIEAIPTRKGALVGTLPGRSEGGGRMVAAHVDTLGAMVKAIKPNGRLRLSPIGGFAWQAFEGENAIVSAHGGKSYEGTLLPDKASIHIFSDEVRESPRTEDSMELRLDAEARSAADVEALGIRVGDFVNFEAKPRLAGDGYVKARYLDDKACVAILFAAIKRYRDTGSLPARRTHFYLSNYEEIGHGISLLPEGVEEFLALDIGTVGEGHTSDERCATIVAKDSRTPYDFGFRRRLVELAERNGVDYRVDVHYRYGSDASLAAMAGFEVNFACIGMGVDATHHYERTHLDGLANTLKLLLAYLDS
ncbi:MAG TPA: M42 family metallopeptidase [Spirochaetales bacterium]|nr:M42 family metallopeptidase [Spirochaetales bacterium]HRY54080.1 M42 family metallopeptidase [Spirochaetia bacterium]HRZ65981.1 M42 family metallopeptidase [Spirochaetia bacterium]